MHHDRPQQRTFEIAFNAVSLDVQSVTLVPADPKNGYSWSVGSFVDLRDVNQLRERCSVLSAARIQFNQGTFAQSMQKAVRRWWKGIYRRQVDLLLDAQNLLFEVEEDAFVDEIENGRNPATFGSLQLYLDARILLISATSKHPNYASAIQPPLQTPSTLFP